jgi:hypothetical protein
MDWLGFFASPLFFSFFLIWFLPTDFQEQERRERRKSLGRFKIGFKHFQKLDIYLKTIYKCFANFIVFV